MATRDDRVTRSRSGLVPWLRRLWRALVAEMLATALLVGLGVATVMPGDVPLTHPALAFGCVVCANAMAFGPTSGAHMNPAVTLAAVVQRQVDVLAGVGYVLAQAVGALLGFGALLAAHPAPSPRGCTLPGPNVSEAAAVAFEAALTGVLVLACCSVWAGPPDSGAPVKLGLVVAGLVYAGGLATGASLNPVRSLAPAWIHGKWDSHWVYWVGPLLGSALAVLVHRYLLTAPEPRALPTTATASRLPEEVALQDKP